MSVKIKVYSDYVLPFCYLAEFPLQEAVRGKEVEVEWMPFELRPYPNETLRPEGDYLQRAWQQSVYPIARTMGVPITLPKVSPQPHTHLAFDGNQVLTGLQDRETLKAVVGEEMGRNDQAAARSRH